MEGRTCLVIFHESTGRVTGQILEGEEIVKELSFYLGNLHRSEPSVVDEMIRARYQDWAQINGVDDIRIEYREE